MKTPLKIACATLLGAAALFAGPATATATDSSGSFIYYVNFVLDGQLVGQGWVSCFDTPQEYVLTWGSDNGEMVIIGQENCSSFPPPLP